MKFLSLLLFCAALLPAQELPDVHWTRDTMVRRNAPGVMRTPFLAQNNNLATAPCKVFPGSGQRPDLNCATIEKEEPNAAEIARAETAARTSQLALANATIQMQRIQADPVYREALAALEAANKATQSALANLAKLNGCAAVDADSLKCKPEGKK